jgi:hypothetical protein
MHFTASFHALERNCRSVAGARVRQADAVLGTERDVRIRVCAKLSPEIVAVRGKHT